MNMDFERAGIEKFDGTEYEVWSTLMEAVLTAKNIWYVVSRRKIESDKTWTEDNRSARVYILLALDHEMIKLVISCETASDIWNRLKAVH